MNFTQVLFSWLILLGDFSHFGGETFSRLARLWRRRNIFLRQCEAIGVSSLGIITVAAVFLGAVLGYQLYVSFHLFGAEALLGGSVGVALFRELAPVMTAIMVTGRCGAAMAAEIASMRISEQIDAIEVMAVDPFEYIMLPRIVAGILMVPVLAVCFAVIGSLAAAAVACGIMDLSYSTYWYQYTKVVDSLEVGHCLVKSAFFGLFLTWTGCFCGFRAVGGARAVGFATRTSVVASCLVILCADYVLTSLLPLGFLKLQAE